MEGVNKAAAPAAQYEPPHFPSASERKLSAAPTDTHPDMEAAHVRSAATVNWNRTARPMIRTSLGGQRPSFNSPQSGSRTGLEAQASLSSLKADSLTGPPMFEASNMTGSGINSTTEALAVESMPKSGGKSRKEPGSAYTETSPLDQNIEPGSIAKSVSDSTAHGDEAQTAPKAEPTNLDNDNFEQNQETSMRTNEAFNHVDATDKSADTRIIQGASVAHEAPQDDLSSDQLTSDYEDDQGVILNVVSNSDLESGEVTEGDRARQEQDKDIVEISSTSEEGEVDEDDDAAGMDGAGDSKDESIEISESENEDNPPSKRARKGDIHEDAEGDAMMQYSDANAGGQHRSSYPSPRPDSPQGTNHEATPLAPGENPTTLAHLGYKDLKLQLRYFYVAQDPRTIPLTDPVRCLYCSKPGHMRDLPCPALTCRHCGAFKAHSSILCPTIQVCTRCRKKGHARKDCPAPLKLTPAEHMAIPCQLCNRRGHIEDRCELLWRTSSLPWTTDVPANVPLSCYECGKSGHLGNDCPTRRPGKPMASSSWSANAWAEPHPTAGIELDSEDEPNRNRQRQLPTRGSRGGRGQMRHTGPIEISSDSADDKAAFNRGRGGGPPRGPRGISIKGLGRGGRGGGQGGGGQAGGSGDHRRPPLPPRGRSPPRYYSNGPDRYQPSRGYDGPQRRRSRSPVRGGRGQGQRYRPMPSAAASAYRKSRT